jgi:hypothetical protein
MASGYRARSAPANREHELRAAIRAARLPARDFRIYDALFTRAQWKTAVIESKFQPRSLIELADWARMSLSNVKRGLNHLEYHGWVERRRWKTPGRGHRTRYFLAVGRDCEPDCPLRKAAKPEPFSGRESGSKVRDKTAHEFRAAAGQEPVSAKSVSDEGEWLESVPEVGDWRHWPAGSIGEWENRVGHA